jgi:hypothetical protein
MYLGQLPIVTGHDAVVILSAKKNRVGRTGLNPFSNVLQLLCES